MAVTTTTILAAGKTALPSSTVTVDAGQVVTIGIATASADAGDDNLPSNAFAVKMVSTGGDDMTLDMLGREKKACQVVGPAEVKVFRPLLAADQPDVLAYKKV